MICTGEIAALRMTVPGDGPLLEKLAYDLLETEVGQESRIVRVVMLREMALGQDEGYLSAPAHSQKAANS
jgi:hypothetical protein